MIKHQMNDKDFQAVEDIKARADLVLYHVIFGEEEYYFDYSALTGKYFMDHDDAKRLAEDLLRSHQETDKRKGKQRNWRASVFTIVVGEDFNFYDGEVIAEEILEPTGWTFFKHDV